MKPRIVTPPAEFIPLPPFSLEGQITAGHLRDDKGFGTTLDKVVAFSDKYRERLIQGGPEMRTGGPVWKTLGRLMGNALVRNNMHAAQAIGLLWVNQYKELDTPLADMVDVLQAQHRLDLVRPGVVLFNGLCRALWTYRTEHATDPSASSLVVPFPDLMIASEELYAKLIWPSEHNRSLVQPVIAWGRMGKEIQKMVGALISGKQASSTYAVIVDLVATVPDSRSWVAGVLPAAMSNTRQTFWSCWKIPSWIAMTKALIDQIDAQEAPLTLGRLADAAVEYLQHRKAPELAGIIEQMALRLMDRYPTLSGEAWLRIPPAAQIRFAENDGLEDTRWYIMENKPKRGFVMASRLNATTEAYNFLLGWLGPRRGNEISSATRVALGGLLKETVVDGLSVPALRSALDYWDLSQTSAGPGKAPTGNGLKNGRKRRI